MRQRLSLERCWVYLGFGNDVSPIVQIRLKNLNIIVDYMEVNHRHSGDFSDISRHAIFLPDNVGTF